MLPTIQVLICSNRGERRRGRGEEFLSRKSDTFMLLYLPLPLPLRKSVPALGDEYTVLPNTCSSFQPFLPGRQWCHSHDEISPKLDTYTFTYHPVE